MLVYRKFITLTQTKCIALSGPINAAIRAMALE